MHLFPPPRLPEIPHLSEPPLLGSIVPFARDPIGFLRRVQQRHGDVVQMTFGPHRVVFLHDPDLIEAALVSEARHLHKDVIYALLKPLLGNGLVTSEDEEWKASRRLCAPSFTPRSIRGFAATMGSCVDRWIAGLPAHAEVDLFHEMMTLSQDIVLKTLFGDVDLDVRATANAIDVVMQEFVHDGQGRRLLLPGWVSTPGRRRARRAVAELHGIVDTIIASRRAGQTSGDDLLAHLIAARDDAGRGMDDRQLRDEALTLFVAGHETTATLLTYTLLLLAAHPEEQRRLAADLTRADAVLDESMRLLPPVWTIGRQTMSPIQLGPHTIPAGIQLLFAPAVSHRDPRWFTDPESFRPDRWLEGRTRPRFAYYPFGGGPRVCIGNHFAKMEARIALERIVPAVSLRPLGPVPPPTLPTITQRPLGRVAVDLRRR